jgi:ribosomal protein L35AE/L33A
MKVDYTDAAKRRTGTYKQSTVDYIKGEQAKNANAKKIKAKEAKDKQDAETYPHGRTTYRSNDDKYVAAVAGRKKMGTFKGKYYGPDELKGNIRLLRKWKAAGKPEDVSVFKRSVMDADKKR